MTEKKGSIPTAADFAAKKSSTGFECSMTGYTTMVQEITKLLVILLSIYQEILIAILPPNLGKALGFFYDGLVGANAWIGYAVSALYFMAEDQGFGKEMCEASGYGDAVIEFLVPLVDFADKDEAN